ncbi:MAG: hypothetical protein WCE94_08670 [Candidatus Methanoperedens sp.]
MSDAPPYTQIINDKNFERIKAFGLPEVKENNPWLLLHIKGDGIKAPESWNAKVYTNKSKELKLVTTDVNIFNDLMMGRKVRAMAPVVCKEHEDCLDCPPQRFAECEEDSVRPRVISIDDSGWGFGIGGTLVGLHDSLTGKFLFREVPVTAYQGYAFDSKAYLRIATDKAVEMLVELFQGTAPSNDKDQCKSSQILIKVCTGYVNTGIVEELRRRGFKVETCAIGEPLQSLLEKQHREYIKCLTNADVYYDPKELDPSNIGRAYYEVLEWIKKNNAWDIAKTGWKSLKKLMPEV